MNTSAMHSSIESYSDSIDTDDNKHIQSSQLAVIKRLEADPDSARNTLRTSGRVTRGLGCTVTQGKFSATMDLGPAMGGQATGPSPGFFARSGIVGCVAIATKMTAAREGLSLDAVDVHIETDFDDLAIFGLGDSSAAPIEVRLNIDIQSDEDPDVIQELVERVLEWDPWYLAIRDAQRTITHVSVDPISSAEG